MRRITTDPRPNWQKRVEEFGLYYHTLRGEPYWDESAFYQFTAYEIDRIEEATNTLHKMCLDLVAEVIEKRMFGLFLIPQQFEEYVVRSWEAEEPSVYGRFDLAFDGVGAPKLLEYNADTPTALVEASVAQWMWLKDVDERADQFNSIHEHLIDAWKGVLRRDGGPIHFAALSKLDTPEDYITAEYMRDTAIQAGAKTAFIDVPDIGWDRTRGCCVV
jgi:glutathionylspermidine synthase